MKEKINVFDYATDIMTKLSKGITVTAMADGKVNPMAISWGMLGREWNKPIFIVYIRENRYTKSLLDKNGEFTINIPVGEFNIDIMRVCGTMSGHKIDKINELGLTLEESNQISVPGFKELPLTLECKVIYKQDQDRNAISPEDVAAHYPADVDSDHHSANKDYHTAYYGEIVDAYIIK